MKLLRSLLVLGECVVIRVESAVDGISKAVVLCPSLQSRTARGQTPQQRTSRPVVLDKGASQRRLSALVGDCGIFMLEVH